MPMPAPATTFNSHSSRSSRYTRTAVILHWLVALLMIANVVLGVIAEDLPDAWIRPAIGTHKSLGITVLGLVLLRLLWRAGHPPPPLPEAYRPWERVASHAAHWLLYALMLSLPLSGWLHDSAWKDAATHPMHLFGLFEWPRIGPVTRIEPALKEVLHDQLGAWHTGLGYGLYVLFALHVLGALKHQWLDRARELQRMSL